MDFTAALDRAQIEHVATQRLQQREHEAAHRTLREMMGRLRQEFVRRGTAPETRSFATRLTFEDKLGPEMRIVYGDRRDTSDTIVEDVSGWDIPVGAALAASNPSFQGTATKPTHARYSNLTLWLPELSDRFGAHDSYSQSWRHYECGGGAPAAMPTWRTSHPLTLMLDADGQLRFALIVDGANHFGPRFDEVLVSAAARMLPQNRT